jgi:hypothetical protein
MSHLKILTSRASADLALRKSASFFRLPRTGFRIVPLEEGGQLYELEGLPSPMRERLPVFASVALPGQALVLDQLLHPDKWVRSGLRAAWLHLTEQQPQDRALLLTCLLKGMLWATTEEPLRFFREELQGGIFVRDQERGSWFLHRPYRTWLTEVYGEPGGLAEE